MNLAYPFAKSRVGELTRFAPVWGLNPWGLNHVLLGLALPAPTLPQDPSRFPPMRTVKTCLISLFPNSDDILQEFIRQNEPVFRT